MSNNPRNERMKALTRSILALLLTALFATPALAEPSSHHKHAGKTAKAAEAPAASTEAAPATPPVDATAAPAGASAAPSAEATPAAAAPVVAPEAVPAPAPAPEAVPAPAPVPEAAPAPVAPPPPPAAAPEAAPVAPPPPPADEESKCVLGDLCFGPVLTGGLFNVIGLGVHARYGDYLGFGADYQFFNLTASSTSLGLSLITLDGRLYPFGGSLFLSAGFAYQNINLKATAGALPVKAGISAPLFKLGLGFMGHDGFVAGIDLALELPLGSTKTTFDTSLPAGADAKAIADYNASKKNIEKAGDLFARALPFMFQLNLLRLGFLF